MKIYLASRYSRREELCKYRDELVAMGHVVTSRWLNGNHQIDDQGLSVEAKAEERQRFALEDFTDVIQADALIAFTEPPRATNSRGGRHVEFGIALGRMMPVYVVGPRENVFHCLNDVRQFETFDDLCRCAFAPF
jgi:nucleoside 2-deoxyribosyltransferase